MSEKFILAASTSAYGKYTLEKALEGVATAGYKYVEIACTDGIVYHVKDEEMTEKKAFETSKLLKSYNLNIYAFSAHTIYTPGKFEERFLRRMCFAKNLGAKAIVTNVPEAQSRSKFVESIKSLISFAEEVDMKICLESPGYLYFPIEEFLNFLGQIDSSKLCFVYDVGNVVTASLGEIDPSSELPIAFSSNKLALIHLKDVMVNGNSWRIVPLGKGQINFDRIFNEIGKRNISVPLTLEMPLFLEGKDKRPAYVTPYSPDFEEITDKLRTSKIYIEQKILGREDF